MSVSKKKRPTIRDIAETANVSLATVSNVLSGKRQVNSDAGKKVLQVAQELGYSTDAKHKPNRQIHFLLYKKFGKVIMDTPFFMEVIGGIEQACWESKYNFSISYLEPELSTRQNSRLQTFLSSNTSALILLGTEMSNEDFEPFIGLPYPVLVLDNYCSTLPLNCLTMDNWSAGRLAVNHFYEMGHRQIGYIGSSIPFKNDSNRLDGFLMGMREHKLELSDENIIRVEPTAEGALQDFETILSEREAPLPTAFFAINDIVAVAAARALKRKGYHLPKDVSLIGMDNVPIGQIVQPPLTTIDVDKRQMGKMAVQRLIQMIEAPSVNRLSSVMNVNLIQRASVARIL